MPEQQGLGQLAVLTEKWKSDSSWNQTAKRSPALWMKWQSLFSKPCNASCVKNWKSSSDNLFQRKGAMPNLRQPTAGPFQSKGCAGPGNQRPHNRLLHRKPRHSRHADRPPRSRAAEQPRSPPQTRHPGGPRSSISYSVMGHTTTSASQNSSAVYRSRRSDRCCQRTPSRRPAIHVQAGETPYSVARASANCRP